jgi:hypothetical protein
MVEQHGFEFDPGQHPQPPPVVPLREPQRQVRQQPPPRPQVVPQVEPPPNAALIDMARMIRNVLATRVLLLVAVITACGNWSYVVVAPSELRIIAAAVFSAVGLWPLVWLFTKKG